MAYAPFIEFSKALKNERENNMLNKKSIISWFLSVWITLQIICPISVSANHSFKKADKCTYSIPTEIISDENINKFGHAARIFEAECSMNEICLLNEDGSNSVYLFDHSVKYTDNTDGMVKDKSNKLYNSNRNNYLYINEDNNICTVFPKKITKHPVVTTIDNYEIAIGIVSNSKYSKNGKLIGDSYVLYNEAFGKNTAIGYMTEFDGYKEEIIIYSENAPKTYSFEIVCKGLLLNNTNGTLTFTDKVSGDIVFTSNPLYIYDSSEQEKGYIDTAYAVTKVDDDKYVMTVELNETFLQTNGLTYPIYIDPSIRYNDTDYIQDAPIYSAKADEKCGNHLVSYVGQHEDAYGVGRLLVRFPEMRETGSVFRGLDADDIISVKVYLYNSAHGSYTTTIKAYQFLGTIGWEESTVTWNNAGADSLGNLQSSVEIPSTANGYYSFDVTEAAKLWVGNLRTADYRSQEGIIFLNANENNTNYTRNFRMSNFGSSYTPYIVVNYSKTIEDGTYYIQNAGTGRYMDVEGPSTSEGANIQQWDFHTDNQEKWIIARQSDGYYTIKSLYSGKYLGVENNSIYNNAAIKQYTSGSGSGTRWGFSVSDSGNYIITAKSAGLNNRVLSVPLDTNNNGTNLIQYSYSDDTNSNDEWILHSLNIKYTNYYDSSFVGKNAMINNISAAVSFANTVYSNLCGITMEMDGDATRLTNFVSDQCPLTSGKSCTNSSCGSVCRTHHKNIINISDQLYDMGINSNERCVIWTNRPDETYCEDISNNETHVTISAIAVVINYRPVIHFMNIEGNSNVQKACMTLNLVHETAHTFTMPDVYGNGHDMDNGYVCIMEYFEPEYAYEFYQDILDGTKQPFCANCSSQIKSKALTNIVK